MDGMGALKRYSKLVIWVLLNPVHALQVFYAEREERELAAGGDDGARIT
jgi:hypothetical protein